MTLRDGSDDWAEKHFPEYSQTYFETIERCACGELYYKTCVEKRNNE